jgi:hypothetical protein
MQRQIDGSFLKGVSCGGKAAAAFYIWEAAAGQLYVHPLSASEARFKVVSAFKRSGLNVGIAWSQRKQQEVFTRVNSRTDFAGADHSQLPKMNL